MRLHFISNGVFTTSIAGGDIHFLKLAEGAVRAGYKVNYFGGHALKEVLAKEGAPGTITLTDADKMGRVQTTKLSGQLSLFRDMLGRYRGTIQRLREIAPEDLVYAVSDYWCDVLPTVRAPGAGKLMVLHMEAPRLGQIVTRSRPDVDPIRLASLHYWGSQEYGLRRFCRLPRKHVLYLHPAMAPRLRALNVADEEMTLVSYGLEVKATDAVPAQPRTHDVVWIGRVHRQKGIDDLLATLAHLAKALPDFRAVIIGNVRDALLPQIEAMGLTKHVHFTGFVSEEEKIRTFKSSRLFLMPSRHEGSPRVIGESIICNTPVVAYDIPNYRPVFGEFVRYVPPFDLQAFQAAALDEIARMRRNENYLERLDLAEFKRSNSWETTQGKFLGAVERLVRR